MLVNQILSMKASGEIFTVAPTATVAEAAKLLSDKRIGAIVVSEDVKVPLGILWLLFPAMPWLAALLAAAIGASLSIIFLRNPRAGVSTRIHESRVSTRERSDAEVEDAAVDAGPDQL